LSDLPQRTEALDLLNGAGKKGWELVAVTDTGLAYLKRQIEKLSPQSARASGRGVAKRERHPVP
jgi:hypothetical protein